MVEVIDMRDIDHEYDDRMYPFLVGPEIMVVPEDMHRDFKKRCLNSPGDKFDIIDAKMYSGGVNAESFLFECSREPPATTRSSFCMMKNGRGEKYPMFETAEDARMYIMDVLFENFDMLFLMIGFVLDKRVNLIGETGWDTIALQAKNRDKR
jgi:hypothetical protein